MIYVILIAIALAFAIYAQFLDKGRNLVAWSAIFICAALLYAKLA